MVTAIAFCENLRIAPAAVAWVAMGAGVKKATISKHGFCIFSIKILFLDKNCMKESSARNETLLIGNDFMLKHLLVNFQWAIKDITEVPKLTLASIISLSELDSNFGSIAFAKNLYTCPFLTLKGTGSHITAGLRSEQEMHKLGKTSDPFGGSQELLGPLEKK